MRRDRRATHRSTIAFAILKEDRPELIVQKADRDRHRPHRAVPVRPVGRPLAWRKSHTTSDGSARSRGRRDASRGRSASRRSPLPAAGRRGARRSVDRGRPRGATGDAGNHRHGGRPGRWFHPTKNLPCAIDRVRLPGAVLRTETAAIVAGTYARERPLQRGRVNGQRTGAAIDSLRRKRLARRRVDEINGEQAAAAYASLGERLRSIRQQKRLSLQEVEASTRSSRRRCWAPTSAVNGRFRCSASSGWPTSTGAGRPAAAAGRRAPEPTRRATRPTSWRSTSSSWPRCLASRSR